jgi:two-component system chemotaxis response regulator CheY
MPDRHSFTDSDYFAALQDACNDIFRDILHEVPQWQAAARQSGTRVHVPPVNIALGLAGDLMGHLCFGLGRNEAKALAEAILADPIPEFDSSAQLALCEFALLVGRFAKQKLRDSGIDLAIGTPFVASGVDIDLLWYGIEPVSARLNLKFGWAQMTMAARAVTSQKLDLKVMVVDDMKFVRFNMAKIVAEHGWQVVAEAENGLEAIEKYEKYRPDVVTMDITMPEMDGIAACREIVARDPDARILMVTAVGQMDKVVEAMHAGAKDFVTKPFKKERVCAGIEALVKGKAQI